jgi:putative peptide zinc metalloprotease protein
MFRLFGFDYGGSTFEVYGSSWSGLECLVVNGREIARKRNFRHSSIYEFTSEDLGALELRFRIRTAEGRVSYELRRGGTSVISNSVAIGVPRWLNAGREPPTAQPPRPVSTPTPPPVSTSTPRRGHMVAWLGLATKIFQGGKALKIALAGMALSGWTILYSLPFALALIATLVFHEYGHLRAMRGFGIKTKGMYLIPFVGGIAVGEQAKTHWQDVYIAMMGPVFGLLMTVAFYALYLATANHFAGLVASVSALVNVFNLLPIHPLDGGRVVRALVFSGRSRWAFVGLLAISAACFAVSTLFGFALLSFFIVIGVIDLLTGWKQIATDQKTRLDGYGMVFSLAWYLVTIALFLAVIVLIAGSKLPGSELAVHILRS